eukprot:5253014-Prymnesium_polylepis.1
MSEGSWAVRHAVVTCVHDAPQSGRARGSHARRMANGMVRAAAECGVRCGGDTNVVHTRVGDEWNRDPDMRTRYAPYSCTARARARGSSVVSPLATSRLLASRRGSRSSRWQHASRMRLGLSNFLTADSSRRCARWRSVYRKRNEQNGCQLGTNEMYRVHRGGARARLGSTRTPHRRADRRTHTLGSALRSAVRTDVDTLD